MAADAPLVSVVMLSYARPALLERAVASIVAQQYPALEVIVVDNPSAASGEIRRLVAGHPGIRFIANAENLGFTGGMNRGIAAATGRYLYLTEDDMISDPDCVSRLVSYMEADPGVGMTSGLMLNDDDGTVRSAGGQVHLGSVFRLEVLGEGAADDGRFEAPYDVTFAPGAMLCIRRELLQRLGAFRDDFFMYLEDVELCLRVSETGKRIVLVPAARARHVRPPPAAAVPEAIGVHKWKNLLATYALHTAAPTATAAFVRYGVVGWLRARGSERRRIGKALFWAVRHVGRLRRERRQVRQVTGRSPR